MISKSASSILGLATCLAISVTPISASAAEIEAPPPINQSIAGSDADAAWAFQRRGGGGGAKSRPSGGGGQRARPSGGSAQARPATRPSGSASRPATRPGAGGGGQQQQVRRNANANINHNANVNQNINRNTNINRDVNVNVDHDYHGWGDDWDYHPVARAAAVTTAAVVTAAAIGSMTRTLPPSCGTVIVNGFSYYQCGSTWYQPQYSGTTVQYVVINPPQ